MFCKNCGTELAEGAKFCKNCGAKIEIEPVIIQDEKSVGETTAKPAEGTEKKPEKISVTQKPEEVKPEKKIEGQPADKGGNNKTLMVVAIAAVVIAVFILIPVIAMKFGKSEEEPVAESDAIEASESTESGADFSASEEPDEPDAKQTADNSGDNDGDSNEGVSKSHEHRYKVVISDKGWKEAKKAAEEDGGYLATITSKNEEEEIIKKLEKASKKLEDSTGKTLWGAWLGGKTHKDKDFESTVYFKWITEEDDFYENWFSNSNGTEPSGMDADGTPENYVMIWCINGEWSWNDQREDPANDEATAATASGRMAYVIEYDE